MNDDTDHASVASGERAEEPLRTEVPLLPSLEEVEAPTSGLRPRRARINLGLDRFSGVYVLVLIIVLFGMWVPDTFLTVLNVRIILGAQAITALAALALLIPMAADVFDLSVGATLGASLMIVLQLQSNGMNALLASVLAVGFGAMVGFVNGFVVVRLNVSSFIATLGMTSVLAALAVAVSGGLQVADGISSDFLKVANSQWFGIPAPAYYTFGLAIIIWVFLEFRPAGRALYAVGGNPRAARLSGIRVDKVVVLSLVASGAIAAFAGVILASSLGAGTPTIGPPYLLPAFTAVFLGATQFKRGRVNVMGTLLAIYLLAAGVKGLQLAGAPEYLPDLFNGIALIFAVALAQRTRKAR